MALKIMKRNVASRSALRRFEFESQVLARLRHPNVAQVYEAGTHAFGEDRSLTVAALTGVAALTEAVPYFAMEYIPGARTITEYAREKKLSTPDRLRLFAKACDAVHHGHQKGIIHRDLKPANILADSAGEPKVIDFGVARATDSDLTITTQQTVIGQLVGTMQYMSPEQCDADPHDLDTRSDVYSLGVVLYELLTGELPYDLTRTPIPTAARIVCEKAPPRPSTLNRKLRGDLEMIVLKALEKDRDKRYQSAADLAQDIRCYLKGEPIEAKLPTPWTRAIRWTARHPVGATVAACLTVALATFGATIVVKQSYVDRFLHERPDRMRLSEDAGEARLLALSGKVLHTWGTGATGSVPFAQLIERPVEFGGGRLALLGFDKMQAKPHSFPGALCAFEAEGDLENPIWQKRIEDTDILAELRRYRGFTRETFGASDCWVLDVFPERPGNEVVAVYSARISSQRVIRVYDLNGELLYQVWHDGDITSCYWMTDARLLVLAGDCHARYWDSRGNPNPGADRAKDYVVFALRPRVGLVHPGWLPFAAGDDPLSPAWYLRLYPDEAAGTMFGCGVRWPPSHDAARSVEFEVRVGEQGRMSVWWVIDQDGNEVPLTRDWGEQYKLNQNLPDGDPDKLPHPRIFELDAMESSEPTRGGEGGLPPSATDRP